MEHIISLSSSVYFADEVFFFPFFFIMKSAYSLSWLNIFSLVLVECCLPRCHQENTMLRLFIVTVRENTNVRDSVSTKAEQGLTSRDFQIQLK